MRISRRTVISVLVLLIILLSGWFWVNPIGKFGYCQFGLTIYNSIPRPISDIQINANGDLRTVEKTHNLTFDKIMWLLDGKADILIIGTGWHGVVKAKFDKDEIKACDIEILTTREAVPLYNKLIKSGKRVAIHVHSTC